MDWLVYTLGVIFLIGAGLALYEARKGRALREMRGVDRGIMRTQSDFERLCAEEAIQRCAGWASHKGSDDAAP